MKEFCLRSQRIVLSNKIEPGYVLIRDGKIHSIEKMPPTGCEIDDLGELTLSAGIVDTHAHLNEPGRTQWEGFETATRAAAASGITTLVDMPLNCIPATTSVKALKEKRLAVSGKASIDYAFWGGVVPGNTAELPAMIDEGVPGFKAFLIDSGVAEFPCVGEKDLLKAMPILAQRKIPLLVHAELADANAPVPSKSYESYLKSRPSAWEVDAVNCVIELSERTGCSVHIVHLSAAQALKNIAEAKERGVLVTVETCPHYLYFDSESISENDLQFKCAPPIRESENREALWHGLQRGTLDCVVSDHSPCTPQLKVGDFAKAWGGIAGLQFSFSVVWTECKKRGFTETDLSRWMSRKTASLAGLKSKGAIRVGQDADLFAWDPNGTFVVTAGKILHRHSVTPYLGKKLAGVVKKTWLRGECIYNEGRFAVGLGREIQRGSYERLLY